MDGTAPDLNDWHKVEFVQELNITPEEICLNISANAGRDLPQVDFNRIAICASGPSLGDHIDDIRARQRAGWSVASMNGSHNFLIDHGILPDYYFQVDARDVNLSFVEKANDHTTYIIASQCQPHIFEALAGRDVRLWQVHNYDGASEAIRSKAPNATVFSGAYNVGQSCLNAIFAMGYRVWHLFGYDASMREGEKHAFDQWQNDREEVHAIMFRGKTYAATATMAHHAQTFLERWHMFRNLGIDIQILSSGLLPDMVNEQIELLTQSAPQACVEPKPIIPRTRPVDRLPVVCWKWKGHIPYTADDVNIWAAMVDRWLDRPSEMICITDDAEGLDGSIRVVPLWRDHFEYGRDWHRLKIFAPEMADIIGPRFVSIDLDTIICDKLDPLFDNDFPFIAWRDPYFDQYCTSIFMMDAGAFPHVYEDFDPEKAMNLRRSGKYMGYDQAWISHVIPGHPRWTRDDGVLSFRKDVLLGQPLAAMSGRNIDFPSGARVINFHGKHNPRDKDVQRALPWIAQHWRHNVNP